MTYSLRPIETTEVIPDSSPQLDSPILVSEHLDQRPKIQFSSSGAFAVSSFKRFKSLWTQRFTLSLLAGQAVSLCLTCTSVTTSELTSRNWNLPTTQSVPVYFMLLVIFTPYTMHQYSLKGWTNMVYRDGWKYLILAAADVEANFMVVKAYQYTDLLSCVLLGSWAIPVCLFLSWLYMRVKYKWSQIAGVLICIGGLAMLVVSDILTHKNWEPSGRGKGDGFMLIGATLYGFVSATEEFLVRKRPLYEVVGQLGMWGFIICTTQAVGLEYEAIKMASWNGATIGLWIAFISAMMVLYTAAPILYRLTSSAYYNLSLLSTNFYGLLFGLFLYHYSPFWLYFVAFAVIIVGLIIYFWSATPEEQGTLDPQAPQYVQSRARKTNDTERLELEPLVARDGWDEEEESEEDGEV